MGLVLPGSRPKDYVALTFEWTRLGARDERSYAPFRTGSAVGWNCLCFVAGRAAWAFWESYTTFGKPRY